MITVIAPHARPEFADNLLGSFRRQLGTGRRLLVVENGPAVGGTWPSDVDVIRLRDRIIIVGAAGSEHHAEDLAS